MSGLHCRHYDGRAVLQGAKCRAGIDPVFSYCDNNRFGCINRIPCLERNVDARPCHLASFPTPEEVAAQDAEFEAEIADFMIWMPKARAAIQEIARETAASAGQIDCPKCGAPMRWSRARSNGHVHASCQTEGCLSWME